MIANHKGEIPFVVLLLPFLSGISLGIGFMTASYLPLLWSIFGGLSIAFIFLNLAYQRLAIYKNRWLGGVLIAFILFLAGCIAAINNNELNNGQHFSRWPAQYLSIKVTTEPQLKNGLLRFTATVGQSINNKQLKPVTGTLLVTIKDSAAISLQYGDELVIPAKYNPIDPPFNPGEFNYKKYLAHQNIYYQAFLYPEMYRVVMHGTGNPLIAFSLRLRQQMINRFKQQMHDPGAIAVASTLILGYKADLSTDILQAYSKTGTIHVLSVSGAHVAIIYILLQFTLGFLNGYRHGRVIKAVIIIALIWYYSLLSGFSPAVCRAAVMISMVIIGKTYARYINLLNILAVSAFALLLYNPLLITDVGFQLSYLAVAGLVVLQPVVYQWLEFKNKWANKVWMACSVSIAAQVITFPLSALYFHQFPVYFLLSNLLIIIPTSVIMYSGVAYLALSWVPLLSTLQARLLEYTILFMNKALAIIEHTPFAGIGKIWLTVPEYLLLYVIIISAFYYLYNKKIWLIKLSLASLLLFATSISLKRYRAENTHSIAFLNLRKNTGIVFKNGSSAIVLTNLADTDKNYKYSVQPYLDSAQVQHISIIGLGQNISSTWFKKRGALMQFYNKRLIIFDKHLQNQQLPGKLMTNYLYITGNPHTNLQEVNSNYGYQTLIIDGSNSSQTIERFAATAKTLSIHYKILKRNNSLITVSN
ncbi:ComEC/Rec2 family competence protein [Mucilaginibacter sp. KACC 22773]|uniref:ComEC/Rec2 family competence protein n=1 Tax=Mucilaginibacter sp. KACC 22773 TaxID=3025671 RepID=UPI002365F600|nr:ComEC/Rec2 family competence protein [Mucilaginibacter sp. KACC 22773]WDF76493.1 ComEC/Rec2 family competence protein [Mucilaginibacter sp. KACC 22773]